jgi:hypothetical protein
MLGVSRVTYPGPGRWRTHGMFIMLPRMIRMLRVTKLECCGMFRMLSSMIEMLRGMIRMLRIMQMLHGMIRMLHGVPRRPLPVHFPGSLQ